MIETNASLISFYEDTFKLLAHELNTQSCDSY